jgi:glycosyltransferase involved in cell wall biosynthesis
MPEVSVVIPLYNKGPYIARALNSILAQTFQNFEVIVVDDGSTDQGADVVRGFRDPKIHFIQQENQGVSAARNRGIEAANAELIAFLDADDEWLSDFLGTIVRLRKKFPESGAYATAFMKKSFDGIFRKQTFSNIPTEEWEGLIPSYFKSCAYGKLPIRSSNVAIPRKVFAEIGTFSIGTWWGEDTDMWGRIALKYPIAFSSDYLAIYHFDDINQVSNLLKKTDMHPFVRTARLALENHSTQSSIYSDLERYMTKEILATAKKNIKAGWPAMARENLQQCPPGVFVIRKMYLRIWTYLPVSFFRLYQYFFLKGCYCILGLGNRVYRSFVTLFYWKWTK